MTDDHPLAAMVDAVREASMLHLASELAAALPGISVAVGRDPEGTWHAHLVWLVQGNPEVQQVQLSWSPEGFATPVDGFTCMLPGEAMAHVIDLVRARGEIADRRADLRRVPLN